MPLLKAEQLLLITRSFKDGSGKVEDGDIKIKEPFVELFLLAYLFREERGRFF